jgi:hypothetical protein
LGRVVGIFGGPWGMALILGLPLLIEAIGWATDSIKENTAKKEQEQDPLYIRRQNEESFQKAIQVAIREGFKDSRIGINIDGNPIGQYQPGSQQDFTGAYELGLMN